MSIGPIRPATNAGEKTDDGLGSFLAFTAAVFSHESHSLLIIVFHGCAWSLLIFGLSKVRVFKLSKTGEGRFKYSICFHFF